MTFEIPLGSITMTVQYLERFITVEKQKNLIGVIKQSAYCMNELIGNVMDFACTRMGEGIVIAPQHVELKSVLEHVVEELKFLYPNRLIAVDLSLQDPIYCDADRLSQLMSNLLANALTRGNPPSPVYFTGHHEENKLQFSVVNNGDPMPESLQFILFTPFKK